VSEPVDITDAAARRLLLRYLDGETEAFGQLAQLYYDRLWAVSLRMCSGDRDEAADALQDALIAAMRGANGFRGDAKVSTWLHRIVVNACLDRHRRRKRNAEAPYTDEDRFIPDPHDRIAERELAWEVEQALRRLPDEQRAAVVLVDVEGWPVTEAAAILGFPAGTIKSRCSRGRAKLAADLQHLRNPPAHRSVEPDSGGGHRPGEG
jgi:RNA polymerase sigma-70 factor (ECF subfamily)